MVGPGATPAELKAIADIAELTDRVAALEALVAELVAALKG